MTHEQQEILAREITFALIRLLPPKEYHALDIDYDRFDNHEIIEQFAPMLKEIAGTDDPSKVDFTGFPTLLERTKEAFPDAILPSEKA